MILTNLREIFNFRCYFCFKSCHSFKSPFFSILPIKVPSSSLSSFLRISEIKYTIFFYFGLYPNFQIAPDKAKQVQNPSDFKTCFVNLSGSNCLFNCNLALYGYFSRFHRNHCSSFTFSSNLSFRIHYCHFFIRANISNLLITVRRI